MWNGVFSPCHLFVRQQIDEGLEPEVTPGAEPEISLPNSPYMPVDPDEAKRFFCDKNCWQETIENTNGPGPEADEYYERCMADCMSSR
jgi:hypothetical protein